MKFFSSDSPCLFHIVFLPLAVCLLYLNTLHSPFVLDDSQIFENNTAPISELSFESLKKIGSSNFHSRRFFPNLSLAVNFSLNGVEPAGYHWVNIGIHAAAALAVYFLLNLVLSLCFQSNDLRLSSEVAFLSALLWAVHPLQTNATTYIIQRMTSMAALFYLLSVLFYLKARLQEGFAKGWYFYLLTGIFGAMALFSKENTAILPVTIAGCELFFIQGFRCDKMFVKKNLLAFSFLLCGFFLISLALLGTDPLAWILEGYKSRDFTLTQRLLTEPRVIFTYLGLLVLPLPSMLNIAYDYPLSSGLLSPPQTLFAIVGLLGLAVAVIVLYKRHRLTSFAVFWFLVNLCIESSFIPLMIIFEHRMYLPSVFLICAGVAWCYRIAGEKLQLARWGVVGLIVLFAFFTWQRNTVWNSEISLWSDVVAKSPGLAWGQVNLGKAYAENGEYTLAEQYLRNGLELDPENGLAYLNLGVMYEHQNRLYEANMVLNKALNAKLGDHAQLFSNLAVVNLKLGNFSEAIQNANQAIELRPYRYKPYDILGATYLKTGNYPQAEKTFLRALEIFPKNGNVYIRLASVYEKQNQLAKAVEILNRAFILQDVNHAKVYNQLSIVFWRMNNLPESIRAGHKALELDPGFLDAYLTLGISYEDSGQLDMAFSQFNSGWQKGLDMVTIYNNWSDHHIKNNNPDRAILYLKQAVSLEPGWVESHRNLARAYGMKGMTAEAEFENKMSRQLSSGQQ